MSQNIYLITGASSDIGIEFLKSLDQKERAQDIIALCQYHSNSTELRSLKKNFKNVDIRLSQCNLSSDAELSDWISGIGNCVPSHIIHLAARRFEYMRIKQFDWEKTMEELNIQVKTLAMLFKQYLPMMAKNKYGKIAILLTAYTIGVPPKFMADYLITKYALLGLMRGAASEYRGTGVTINGLSPNMIETKFLSNIDKRVVEMTAENSSMGRNMEINEVVKGLEFLLSDATDYMTGINLNMTGGDRM